MSNMCHVRKFLIKFVSELRRNMYFPHRDVTLHGDMVTSSEDAKMLRYQAEDVCYGLLHKSILACTRGR